MKIRKGRNSRWLPALLLVPALLLTSPAHSAGWLFAQDDRALPMWEVTDGSRTLYLLGSIHLLRPEVYPLDAGLYDVFDRSSVVAFELDLAEMMASAHLMMERGMLPEGRTLRDELPADVYAAFRAGVDTLPLPAEMFERMKPWFAAMSLSAMVLQHAGYDAASGLDMHFHRRASEADMRIVGLETLEEQLAVFDDLSATAQAEFLRHTLHDLDDTVEMLDEATELWRHGDARGLADMFIESMQNQPELMERLLFQRNRDWIPGIEALLHAGEPAIVIVGMGHLVGEGSVVELLRERGHDVTRVTCAMPAVACTP